MMDLTTTLKIDYYNPGIKETGYTQAELGRRGLTHYSQAVIAAYVVADSFLLKRDCTNDFHWIGAA